MPSTDFNPRTPCGVRHEYQLDAAQNTRHFNPRTPCGVRLTSIDTHLTNVEFQSTHPLRGATHPGASGSYNLRISIHAPLAGCDAMARVLKFPKNNFNPRTPCGVRLLVDFAISIIQPFQSTHPLRGATRTVCRCGVCVGHFNPRTPCGVRRSNNSDKDLWWEISIHAPLAGCDASRCLSSSSTHISIHAPLAGCDPGTGRVQNAHSQFQSTHPLRGATISVIAAVNWVEFQSTHPLRGATGAGGGLLADQSGISIHAPLAGCDPCCIHAGKR